MTLSPFIGVAQGLPFPINPSWNSYNNNPQSFDLGDPSNMQQSIEYDPETGRYVFKQTVGQGLLFRNPTAMSQEDYLNFKNKQFEGQNWEQNIEEESVVGRSFELPIKIGSKVFESIFGPGGIVIRPQGNVEVQLGLNHSRYDNPILPMRQRRITRFDFQQNINMDIVGQIGSRLKIGAKYNTQAAFDFENISKLEHTGDEDQIIQKVALGQVSLSLPTSLIQGSQTLFGAKTQLKFGRSTFDLILAQSKGKRQEINITGKSQVQKFEITADNYESNRHYFLNLFYHDDYDSAMMSLPNVNATRYITRIEVWVTNRSNITDNTRNILAFSDLGEGKQVNCQGNPGGYTSGVEPDNQANNLYDWAANQPLIRNFLTAVPALNNQVSAPGPFKQAIDYEKVENARKLTDQEFSYNALLGYLSLNNPLNNDEVLAVAYEYTYRGQTYQVGEFSTDGSSGQEALILKLLKPTITSPKNKIWDLMMKNVYSIGAYQVDQSGFKVDIFYNNPATSVPLPVFPMAGLDDKQLVTLLEMDRLNQNNQPFSDGVFDYVPFTVNGPKIENGGTINRKNGRIFFSTVEPFGKTLANKLQSIGISQNVINSIAYYELYDSTKTAAQQIPSKNRFLFKGEYQSSISSDIPLNALNVPQGAVTVTAGGIKLVEGTDYSVDYNLGRVKILNTGILESNTPIKISIESNSVFGFQARSLMGGHYQYRLSDKMKFGATWVRMSERPITQKVDFGSEPFKNNILGVDFSIRTDLPFLTRLVDLLPVISTNQMSTLSVTGEAAYLIPGQPKVINKSGISYVDDFEASQSTIDLKSASAWRLASIPQGQPDLFPEAATQSLAAGFRRAKMAWYTIDPLFYQSNNLTPQHIKENASMLADSRMRLVNFTDIFPNQQLQYGSIPNITVFDVCYYPKERGMYNYDTTNTVDSIGHFINPENRWAGIMRGLSTNDFELANVQYIQFWMLDPFNDDAENENPNSFMNGGDLYLNLGNVSEDVLPDSRKEYENGIPPFGTSITDNVDTTLWALVSNQQVVVNAFDTDPQSRLNQDIGLDGWNSNKEITAFQSYVNWVQNNATLSSVAKARMIQDPSNDDYNYYLDDNYDNQQLNILQRYKRYNGMEGNSPTTNMSDTANLARYPTQATNMPDLEDINQDNNLSESEAYFQYKMSIRPSDMQVGKNFITNMQIYHNGNKTEKWFQVRIPLVSYEKKINGIQDFRSIRFMRLFMKNFDEQTQLRFAKMEFIRGEWRPYRMDLTQPGISVQTDPNLTDFNISAVNVEENDQRTPVKYEVPPGIVREIDPSQTYQRQMNEQSLLMNICNLQDGDARAAYKNVVFDVRTYKKLKMFVHAEEVNPLIPLNDKEVTVFVRLGTDFVDNYYEYELPLYKTQWGATSPEDIWPEKNNVEIVFDELLNLKKERNNKVESGVSGVSTMYEYSKTDPVNGDRKIKVKGSPNLQAIKTIMIGVRNPLKSDPSNIWPDDGQSECVIVWVNELRLTDFVSNGGGAAVGQAQLQVADFATVAASGNYSGINWGSVESRVQERQRNEKIGVDMNTTVQLGQFFGKQAKVSLPFFYGYSRNVINPEYDPFSPDIKLADYDLATRRERARLGQDFNERRSFNFTNVRKEAKAGAKPAFWRIANWSASYSYAENLKRDFNTNYDRTKNYTSALNYNYTFAGKAFEPFKKWKPVQKSKWLALVKDFNLFLMPKNLTFTNDFLRMYNERQVRNNLVPNYQFNPVFLKKFEWNRNYNVGYDLTKNLKASFSATNKAIFVEGNHRVDRKNDPMAFQEFKDSIRSQLATFGKTMEYSHNYSLSYTVPFDKFPLTDWLTTNVKYSGTYNWQRAPLAQTQFGNTIQNNRSVNFTSQANFVNLYNKVPLFKKVLSDGRNSRGALNAKTNEGANKNNNPGNKKAESEPPKPPKPVEEMTKKERRKWAKVLRKFERKKKKEERDKKKVNPIIATGARLLMTVRNVSGTYSLDDGTQLPGTNQESRILGMNSNNFGMGAFVFGKQGYDLWGRENGYSIADLSASNGWLVQNENLNKQFTTTHSTKLNLRATLEPLKDLNIEMKLNRNYGRNSGEFFRWNTTSQQFEGQSRFESATLTYSTITWGTAFIQDKKDRSSEVFSRLLANRAAVSQLIGATNPYSSALPSGYFNGYSGNQQEVVIGAFLTAYGNKDVNAKNINPIKNIPLPNWSITYNGLSKFEFAKKVVKSFVLRHAYNSTVTVNGMQSNMGATTDSKGNPTATDINNNFISPLQVQNITISEQFSPLIGMDATWSLFGQSLTTKFEYKKDRMATLSLNNNQITEVKSNEIVVGMQTKITKVKLVKRIPANDLNAGLNFSFRDNATLIRKVVENTNQATAGQTVVSFKLNIDYNLSQNLTISYYYDQNLNTPKVATSYPTGNVSTGIKVRFNLAGVQ
ncbi:MAG: cell surface protein SprA [Flavobacteriia bacterium]|nr:cell surface protein SprA [Flavobacteriia bacterium]